MELISEIKQATDLELIEYIGWKIEYPQESEAAFDEFYNRFHLDIKKMAEVACSNWGYNEVIALDIVKCTLQRVWKYPSYKHEKSKATKTDSGIKLWLHRIVFTQLANYFNKGFCFEPDIETDLCIINSIEELADNISTSENNKSTLLKKLEIVDEALSQLSDKHKIIYLTYSLYAPDDKTYIPRSISKKLQDQLGLVPASIRKYKEEAKKNVNSYLSQIND